MFFFILQVYLDNIILKKDDFNSFTIGKREYLSTDLKPGNSYKISFPGTYIYKLIHLENKKFILKDFTKYLPKYSEMETIKKYKIKVSEPKESLKENSKDFQVIVTNEKLVFGLMEDTKNIVLLILGLGLIMIIFYIMSLIDLRSKKLD